MIKILIALMLALPLVSFAPAPRVLLSTGSRPAARTIPYPLSPIPQACTWETASARLRQQIEDPIGYPFGHVEAWSCDGDSQAVIAELSRRVAEMQAQAADYRAAHPIAGTH